MTDEIIRDTVIGWIDPDAMWPEPEDTKYWDGEKFVYGAENAKLYTTVEAYPVLNEVRADGVKLLPSQSA